MADIIYITGRGHCGSTVLDLMLGAHPDIIGVGELLRLFKSVNTEEDIKEFFSRREKRFTKTQKDYWDGFKKILKGALDKTLVEKYRLHHKYFQKRYPGKIMVDSSKNIDDFTEISEELKTLDFLPVFLLKDVRSDAHSMKKKRNITALRSFLEWYYVNLKIKGKLKDKQHILLGYEELAHDPESVLKIICDSAGVKFHEDMLFPSKSNSVSINGNGMRNKEERKEKVFYDYRWMTDNRANLPATIFPFIMSFNRKHVYSNGLMSKYYKNTSSRR